MLRRIENLKCTARRTSATGRSGKGRIWRMSQQLAELCMQGWMNDECESALEEWEVWLVQKGEEKSRAEKLEQHSARLEKPVRKERACLTHITKPMWWRGGAQVLEDVFEDAQPLKRVEVKRQEWKHLQVDTLEKGSIDNPWENEALHELEETLSPTRAEELKRGSTQRSSSRWFPSQSAETCQQMVVLPAIAEQ